MKKIYLLVTTITLVLLLNSCSSSDSVGDGQLSFKVNGVLKNFKVVSEYAGNTINVYGYIGNGVNPTEVVEFNMSIGDTTNPLEDFSYYNNETNDNGTANVTSNVTLSTSSEAKGTFSGTIIPFGSGNPISISDGRFSVKPKFAG